jgi:hypothetical protein
LPAWDNFCAVGETGLASPVRVGMKSEDVIVLPPPELERQASDARWALVNRVLHSTTFEHCPKLRAFLEYVCRCSLEGDPAAATEPQIGIHVFGRPPGYNTNDDNIVRSQARLLRMKLEHHFANEGRFEPVVISIPKGRYLPAFESRFESSYLEALPAVEREDPLHELESHPELQAEESQPDVVTQGHGLRTVLWALGLLLLIATGWGAHLYRSGQSNADDTRRNDATAATVPPANEPVPAAEAGPAIRIAAGYSGAPLVDSEGRQWAADEYYQGGVSESGPRELFPPAPDPKLFSRIREGASVTAHAPMGFRYDIPVPPGTYELRLYFADPVRSEVPGQDGQHLRHFQVNLNGTPILTNFDAVADGGYSAVDVRAFKGVSPAEDGKVHVEFVPSPDKPILSALELTPGTPGKLVPVRLTAHTEPIVDAEGNRWGGDKYYVFGNTLNFSSPTSDAKLPALYSVERFGNFSYAIPVPPGSYTVRLHFMETFWGSSTPSGPCGGVGCRVFDVACNGQMLLKDFDIFKAAGGNYRPIVKSFSGLHPNGQGKLLLSFSPSSDYAEIRAIEVVDESGTQQARTH